MVVVLPPVPHLENSIEPWDTFQWVFPHVSHRLKRGWSMSKAKWCMSSEESFSGASLGFRGSLGMLSCCYGNGYFANSTDGSRSKALARLG